MCWFEVKSNDLKKAIGGLIQEHGDNKITLAKEIYKMIDVMQDEWEKANYPTEEEFYEGINTEERLEEELSQEIEKHNAKQNEETFYCHSKVVGTTFREKEQKLPWDEFRAGDLLILEREPTNEFDKNAVKVIWSRGIHIGYIPKQTAISVSELIKDGHKLYAKINEITGGTDDKTNKGINIKIFSRGVVPRTDDDHYLELKGEF